MSTSTTPSRRVVGVTESCDCGGDYPCSHGTWFDSIQLDVPKPDIAQRYTDKGDPIPDYAYNYSEICEFPDWLGTLLLLGPDLADALTICANELEALLTLHGYKDGVARRAVADAQKLLRRLDADPVDVAFGEDPL